MIRMWNESKIWNQLDLVIQGQGKIRNATSKGSGFIIVRSTWCFRAKEYYYGVIHGLRTHEG